GSALLVHNASCPVADHATKCKCTSGGTPIPAVKEGEVGRFGDLADRARTGDNLTPNHIPQAALNFLPYRDHAAIVMTHADHLLTRTYGPAGRVTKRLDANLSFREVLAKDLQNLRQIGEKNYGDPGHFNKQIKEILGYYRTNYPDLMKR
ncbi:hypothetical protein ONA70_36385, partial [Micromonospora yasonensis]|uniref:hypothetical protein n=1 Tax=Micromonospora yasonensis TaxID=1128667 RepID=UPI002232C2FE